VLAAFICMKLATLVATVAACHGAEKALPDGAADAAADAAPSSGLSRCDDDTPTRPMLVAISADDIVELYALHPGKIDTTGIRLTGIHLPSQIVMRDDAAEALVVYGGWGTPFGVAAISIAPDGSSAQVEQVLQIGTDSTAISVAYADHDHAVVALEGMKDEVVGLSRGTNGGPFVAGPRVAAPADFPLAVMALPSTGDVLMSRSQVGVDPTLDIYRLRDASGTWMSSGTHTSVGPTPIAMAIHPTGAALFVPTSDPQNQPSASNLLAPGQMHAVKIGDNAFSDGGTVPTKRIGSLIAIDPGGHFVVTEGNVYMLDRNGNPNVYAYTWQTVRVADDGALGDSFDSDPTAGLLFDDLQVAPSGQLVAARELYEGSVPPAQQYPLELWAQPSWGAWQLCDTAYLSGGAHVAIGR
jgi:hypothetical protein